MKRLLIVVLIMFSIGASAQIQENLIRMSKDTTKFLVKYYPPQLIRLDSTLYALTHATLVGQSMRTVIDNGWAYKVGDGRGGSGGGSYTAGNGIVISSSVIKADTGILETKALATSQLALKANITSVPHRADSNQIRPYGYITPLAFYETVSSLVSASRTITINGTTKNLGSDQVWTISGGGSDSTITAGPISSLPALAYNPGTGITAAKWIQMAYYQTKVPTASLSGGTNTEKHSSGTMPGTTLSWSGGRQDATAPLSTIVVDGVNQTFTPCTPAPCTNTGTKAVTVTYNTPVTFTNTVTTTDGKTASATSSYSFYELRYWGFVSSTSPTDGTIQALTNTPCYARTQSATGALPPSGSQYFCIAFATSFDPSNVSQIWIGGLDQTGAFTRTTRTFVNASGYSQSYIIYVTNSSTSGSISYSIQ